MLALTPRERDVLSVCWAHRTTNYERLSGLLGMSPATVHSHLAHVRSKLEVRRTWQAVVVAHEKGLLDHGAKGSGA
jgi:DNA-binding CsgD family transcriptional regulator